jgi:Domain of unknown function (DUF4338)
MDLVNAVVDTHTGAGSAELARRLRKLASDWEGESWALELRAVSSVFSDLIDQGWAVAAVGPLVELTPPGLLMEDEKVEAAKERIRQALRVAQQRQLEEPSVKRFIAKMERQTSRPAGKGSIASVIEDGAALSLELAKLVNQPAEDQISGLRGLISPSIEIVDDEAVCPHSGLRLLDIWRYFRHTWSLEYRSIPGRQLPILIRNAARRNAPVMGIAMLASPVVRLKARDDWIGWTVDAVAAAVREGRLRQSEIVEALATRLDCALTEIRSDDLLDPTSLRLPADADFRRLERRAGGAAAARKREAVRNYDRMIADDGVIRSARDETRQNIKNADLVALSEDPLFVQKRADTLLEILRAQQTFRESGALSREEEPLRRLLWHPLGRKALETALKEVRKAGLSSQVADLSVCGAVAPYGSLIGGKLVALLMASKEVRQAYHSRYTEQPSIISSQMAGRLIYRSADLQVLTTTSLYGNGSSQYNRLRLRAADHPSLSEDIEWQEVAHTLGYGTYHLSPSTLRLLRDVADQRNGARRINNRFGEGASPRMRQTREGLAALGIEPGHVMDHATPRILYGCDLNPAARPRLLGIDRGSPSAPQTVDSIAAAWRERWLRGRISQPGVLEAVAKADAVGLAEALRVPAASELPDEPAVQAA